MTDVSTGLTDAEVKKRFSAGQVNTLPATSGKTASGIVRDNLFTFFNLINLALASLIMMVGSFKNLTFLAVAVANTVIGILQELRAKRTLDRLSLLSQAKARVVRDSREQLIDISQLVTDELVLLAAGSQISADSVVREGFLEVNESLLTGESDTVQKIPGDPLHSGSFVVSGSAYTQILHVGKENYANRITAEAKTQKRHSSQLRDAVNKILKWISIVIVPMGVGLFLRQFYTSEIKGNLVSCVTSTVAAVLGMIPEGLVLLVSMALAVGVIRLGQRKTLVHELFSLETLARVDTLCLDKTGTLTEGRLKVEEVILLEEIDADEIMGNLLAALRDENPTANALGDRFTPRFGWQCLEKLPFSSARKYSGARFAVEGTFIMGALEFMFPGGEYPDLRKKAERYTKNGLRVIILAQSPNAPEGMALPADLQPLALFTISDVLRPSAKPTIEFFVSQDVEPFVISGDHPATVAHIATLAGLPGADKYVDASTLSTPQLLQAAVAECRVFGRVTPGQKREIIRLLRQQGRTVAMTGDGVNDVPALKEADCSIAMAQGSDAAKSCANIVLLHSDFSALPHVVREGRRVINNIQSAASLFLVKTLFSLVLTVITLCFSVPYPFMPIHLTVISIFAVGIPAFILSLEPNFSIIRPGFLRQILHNALTGAITIILSVTAITVISQVMGYTEEARTTLCMISTGIASLCMIKQVYPLESNLRKLVYGVMFGLFLFGMLFMQGLLSLIDLTYQQSIIILIFVIIAQHTVAVTSRVLGWFKQLWRKRRILKAMKRNINP